ncbi:MAG: glycosyltransferase [Terracidiphilus sp.]|jgi:glycosyltransferase involved in cell wall biosynthesis
MTSNVEPRTDVALASEALAAKAPAAAPRQLLYLLSRYPGISHTFFLNEIRELRKHGFAVEVASINQPDRSRSSMPAAEIEEAEKTFYIKSTGAGRAAAVAAKTLLLRPWVFARGLKAALNLGRWDASATLYAFFYFAEALILGDWMRSRGHRHLHIHFCGPVATVGMLASLAWGFSYSLTVHGPDEFYDVEKFYLRQKVVHAKFVLCISDFCRSQLMRVSAPEHWDKMRVVRMGVDPDVFLPMRPRPVAEHPLEILCVGRLVPSKGQLILLRACAILLSKGYLHRVRLVGAGPDREHLQACAQQMGIEAIFEGAKSHAEIRQLLGRADIFALASFAEGVPVALMEAMAMEVPCVSTGIAGIPELIRDGLDGLLVPASSAIALAAALERLAEEPLLRRSLGLAGRKRVHDFYNLTENVSLLASVFSENALNTI